MTELTNAVVRLTVTMNEATYAFATAAASVTRLSRAMWPLLPLWKRIWLTYRRKGW